MVCTGVENVVDLSIFGIALPLDCPWIVLTSPFPAHELLLAMITIQKAKQRNVKI